MALPTAAFLGHVSSVPRLAPRQSSPADGNLAEPQVRAPQSVRGGALNRQPGRRLALRFILPVSWAVGTPSSRCEKPLAAAPPRARWYRPCWPRPRARLPHLEAGNAAVPGGREPHSGRSDFSGPFDPAPVPRVGGSAAESNRSRSVAPSVNGLGAAGTPPEPARGGSAAAAARGGPEDVELGVEQADLVESPQLRRVKSVASHNGHAGVSGLI